MDRDQIRANRRAWDAIAHSFDETRRSPWGTVTAFLDAFPPGTLVLDAGCGNGRHLRIAAERRLRVIGLDLSQRLLGIARTATPTAAGWVQGIVERLPFRDASVDVLLASAVLHHVRGRDHRIATLHEWMRVLRPGGKALLSVWSRDQPRFSGEKAPAPPADGRPVEPGDAQVRWTQNGLNVDRFIHLYSWAEFQRELDYANVPIERAWPESIATPEEPDNYFAILRKRPGSISPKPF